MTVDVTLRSAPTIGAKLETIFHVITRYLAKALLGCATVLSLLVAMP